MNPSQKKYTEEFKKQAVDLLLSSQRPLIDVCRELGVSTTTLRQWKTDRMIHGKSEDTIPGPRDRSIEELERVNRQLREQLAFKERACEILKKAIAICSEQQGITTLGR